MNKEISTHLTLHRFETIDGIFQAALEIERELKERSTFKPRVQNPSGWTKNKDQPGPMKLPEPKTVPKFPPKPEAHKYPNPKGFQCFKCQGWGHKANECPNRRNVILREGKVYYLGEEVVSERGRLRPSLKMERKPNMNRVRKG